MSKISLKSTAGNGTVTLEAPNNNSIINIKLPSQSGELMVGNTHVYRLNAQLNGVDMTDKYLCKIATENFDCIEDGRRILLFNANAFETTPYKPLYLRFCYGLNTNSTHIISAEYEHQAITDIPVVFATTSVNDSKGITKLYQGQIIEVIYYEGAWRTIGYVPQ